MGSIFFIILLGISFFLQISFTILQINNFTYNYNSLKQFGRVVIGRAKGGIRCGSIVMFAVDKNGYILRSVYIKGVSVLSRFKNLEIFNGKNIVELCLVDMNTFPIQVKKAIMNAFHNYVTVVNGGTIKEPKSPLVNLINLLFRQKKIFFRR